MRQLMRKLNVVPRRQLLRSAAIATLTLAGSASSVFAQAQPAFRGQPNFASWPERAPKLVGYLPDYDGSYADFAKSLDFSKMTHLYLAFGLPPTCNGTCTKESDMTFALGQTDADIKTIVKRAHAAGTKVILSIGGGGGDQQILQFYDAGLSRELVKSLNRYVAKFDLDGVDLDIEDPDHMGQPYLEFTRTLIETFHPQCKIVTAAVAEYLQDSMPDAALHLFDFVNVMNYSNYSDAVQAMTYYHQTKRVPREKLTLGVPFFAQSGDGNIEETFSTVQAAYPNAFDLEMVSGGSLDDGITLYYVGGPGMERQTELGKQYGGVMIWELSQDAAPPNSLYKVIEKRFPPKPRW